MQSLIDCFQKLNIRRRIRLQAILFSIEKLSEIKKMRKSQQKENIWLANKSADIEFSININ